MENGPRDQTPFPVQAFGLPLSAGRGRRKPISTALAEIVTILRRPTGMYRRLSFAGGLAFAVLLVPRTILYAQVSYQDDAGSGRDAPSEVPSDVTIQSAVVYDGFMAPALDDADTYSIDLQVGDEVDLRSSGTLLCGEVWDTQAERRTEFSPGCEAGHLGSGIRFVADQSGTWHVRFWTIVPDEYSFAVAVNTTAPLLGLHPTPSGYHFTPEPPRPSPIPTPERVVVLVADTGVNPYHEIYHRPDWTTHPCHWVDGFEDCSVPALPLSVGRYETWEAAFEADRDVWSQLEIGRWYWIPETNIIGAVCDSNNGPTATNPESRDNPTCILDDYGHGTGTTSSVLTENPDALLLVHDGDGRPARLAGMPVTPDVQSHSWGPRAPRPQHAVDPLPFPGLEGSSRGAVDDETIFFIAAGNQAPFPAPLDADRARERIQIVGGAFPGYWYAGSWSFYDFASWMCRPLASHNEISGWSEACGTSFAAPTAAGAASKALLDIRRAEGYFGGSTVDMVSSTVSRTRFIEAMRLAASYGPDAKYGVVPRNGTVPLPQEAPYLFWGYGWLDGTISGAITRCALQDDCPEKSEEAQRYNALRQFARRTTTEDAVPPFEIEQDDAGSGRDAPLLPPSDLHVESGIEYTGFIAPLIDHADTYALDLSAGDQVVVRHKAAGLCLQVRDPDLARAPVEYSCDSGYEGSSLEFTADRTGIWHLLFSDLVPVPGRYAFIVGVNGSVPSPGMPLPIAP